MLAVGQGKQQAITPQLNAALVTFLFSKSAHKSHCSTARLWIRDKAEIQQGMGRKHALIVS